MGVITLLTDFGHNNWFAGTMKGVTKAISPSADIVDICHEVQRLVGSYAEGRPGELVAVVGSSGFLEIAVNGASAREILDIGEGGEFILKVL